MAAPVLDARDSDELFEGPEKTLTICFRLKKVDGGSLRLIPRESWEEVLRHARCEILSVVESSPAGKSAKSISLSTEKEIGSTSVPQVGGLTKVKEKRVSSKGLTGYLLSESSLFVSDSTLTLKTCGRTTPLAALEPALDMIIPKWRTKHPESYLKYVSFTRLGYMFPKDQLSPHTSWEEEVQHLEKHFAGEAVVLGPENQSTSHVYVASYLPKDQITGVFSSQVSLTKLDPADSMTRFVDSKAEDKAPLARAWPKLHGSDPRSIAARARLDECFFQPIGYSANAVFGTYFTTIHATPQPSCSYISVETSLPLDRGGRQHFVAGAADMAGSAGCLSMTEFALTPMLFSGGQPVEIPGFQLQQSSQTITSTFACSHHHYIRKPPALSPSIHSPPMCYLSAPSSPEWGPECYDQEVPDMFLEFPLFEVAAVDEAPIRAAEHWLMPADNKDADTIQEKPVGLVDLAVIRRQAELWHRLLPRVEPFYAVKCNPHPAIVKTLWEVWRQLGVGGFDCASPVEMEIVANVGVDLGNHVVYANPCKQASAVTFARKAGVRWVVFDNVAELQKIKDLHPSAELILRVQTDDALAQCPLSNKFGAAVEDCDTLLGHVQALGMNLVGVSFHVGSGCSQLGAYQSALRRAKIAFQAAERRGFSPKVLDIGGGFPGWDEEGTPTFAEHAMDIRNLLDELFPSPDIRVIAEPGRFFAAKSQAMLATVVSVADTTKGSRYYLNDGLYGSFNCLLYDHAVLPDPVILRAGKEISKDEAGPAMPCTLFGPTCDGFDVVAEATALPRLQIGDRLLFPNMGAYTSCASTHFNGFDPAQSFIYESRLRT